MIILITEVMLLLKGGLLTEGSPTCEALLPDSWVIETNRLHPFHRQTKGRQEWNSDFGLDKERKKGKDFNKTKLTNEMTQRALDQPRQPEGAPSLSLSPGRVLFII